MNVRLWFTRLRTGALAAAAAATLISANPANAALLVYEPFNYPTTGSIFTTGQAVATVGENVAPATELSTGWTEAWRSNGDASVSQTSIRSGSMSYSVGGRTLRTAGNKMWTTGNSTASGDGPSGAFSAPVAPATGLASASPYRRILLANQRGYSTTADSVTWISYLGQAANIATLPYNGTAADGGTINYGRAVGGAQLFNNATDNTGTSTTAGTEHLSFGRASQDSETTTGAAAGPSLGLTNDTWGAVVGGTGRGTVASTDAANHHLTDLVMYLVKVTHRAGVLTTTNTDDDLAEIWINPASLTNEGLLGAPTLSIVPTQGNVHGLTVNTDFHFNRIRLFGGSNNATVGYGSVMTDEIRIGETFADVTPNVPEPGTAVLAAMGLVALAARRRK